MPAPPGFYIIRGGPDGDDAVIDTRFGTPAVLPGPAPKEGDKFPPNKTYREILSRSRIVRLTPTARSSTLTRVQFFDGIVHDYIPNGEFSPIWNPEFFGNTLIANGNTWPFLTVEQDPLPLSPSGRLPGPLPDPRLQPDSRRRGVDDRQRRRLPRRTGNLTADHGNRLLMAPAERADVIVDFSNVPAGNYVLANVGPDEPVGGGVSPVTTLRSPTRARPVRSCSFRVVPARAADDSTPPRFLQLPRDPALPAATFTRQLALIEEASEGADEEGEEVEGPVEALLGTVAAGVWTERKWMDPVTENPDIGATEIWENLQQPRQTLTPCTSTRSPSRS
jgi:hypothetical protein